MKDVEDWVEMVMDGDGGWWKGWIEYKWLKNWMKVGWV